MKRNAGYLIIGIAAGLLTATVVGLSIASYIKSRKRISEKITAVSGLEINPYEKNQQSMQKDMTA